MPRLTDNHHMPMGKYGPEKGDHRLLKDVPPSYLLWLWDNVLCNTTNIRLLDLQQYVKDSYRALIIDAPDYIPAHPPMD